MRLIGYLRESEIYGLTGVWGLVLMSKYKVDTIVNTSKTAVSDCVNTQV